MNNQISTTSSMVTVTELATILKVHRQTIRRMADHGVIPGVRIGLRGRDWRFDLAAVEEALTARRRRGYGAAR